MISIPLQKNTMKYVKRMIQLSYLIMYRRIVVSLWHALDFHSHMKQYWRSVRFILFEWYYNDFAKCN